MTEQDWEQIEQDIKDGKISPRPWEERIIE